MQKYSILLVVDPMANLPAMLWACTELGLTPAVEGLGKSNDAYGVTNDAFELARE